MSTPIHEVREVPGLTSALPTRAPFSDSHSSLTKGSEQDVKPRTSRTSQTEAPFKARCCPIHTRLVCQLDTPRVFQAKPNGKLYGKAVCNLFAGHGLQGRSGLRYLWTGSL